MLTAILAVLVGLVIGFALGRMSRLRKYDGSIDIVETPEKKTFSLEYDGDPDEIDKKQSVLFKVNKPTP